MKTLWNWLAAKKAARKVVDSLQPMVSPAMVEPLEDRCFLSVAPHVSSVYADNRGLMTITFDQKLNAKSVNRNSVKVSKATSGADEAITNAGIKYSAKTRTLTINAKTSADTVFKVRLVSKLIKSVDGVRLDGEFKATGKSGNGRAGGDYFVMTQNTPAGTDPSARFTTNLGVINVLLYATVNPTLADNRATPITVAKFLEYANAGDWDGTVFHRSVNDFVIQGGGFKVDSTNKFVSVHDNPPTITNEPKNAARPANPGNIIGTIAMARSSGVNSATDQWYFNTNNNGGGPANLDTANEGYTVFGNIVGAKGLAVANKINEPNRIVNLNDGTGGANSIREALKKFFNPAAIQGAFGEFPLNGTPTVQTFSPKANSVIVTRLAINQAVVAGVRAV